MAHEDECHIGRWIILSDEQYMKMMDSVRYYMVVRDCHTLQDFVSNCLADIRAGSDAVSGWYERVFSDSYFNNYVTELCDAISGRWSSYFSLGADFDDDGVSLA